VRVRVIAVAKFFWTPILRSEHSLLKLRST
jgi:hypothetical protein